MPPTPDALLMPHSVADDVARTSVVPNLDKANRIADVSDPILGVDHRAGERSWIRNQKDDRQYFITKSPTDSLCEPNGGPPRYRWESVGQYKYGYLNVPRSDEAT